jgi:ribonuclease PH
MHGGRVLVDLDYAEDSTCETDMNVVMTGSGGFVEVQGTAEGAPYSQQDLDAMLVAARSAIAVLVQRQREALGVA